MQETRRRKPNCGFTTRRIFGDQPAMGPAFASLLQPAVLSTFVDPPVLFQRGSDLIVELDPRITPRMLQQSAHHTVSSDVFADHAPLIIDYSLDL